MIRGWKISSFVLAHVVCRCSWSFKEAHNTRKTRCRPQPLVFTPDPCHSMKPWSSLDGLTLKSCEVLISKSDLIWFNHLLIPFCQNERSFSALKKITFLIIKLKNLNQILAATISSSWPRGGRFLHVAPFNFKCLILAADKLGVGSSLVCGLCPFFFGSSSNLNSKTLLSHPFFCFNLLDLYVLHRRKRKNVQLKTKTSWESDLFALKSFSERL